MLLDFGVDVKICIVLAGVVGPRSSAAAGVEFSTIIDPSVVIGLLNPPGQATALCCPIVPVQVTQSPVIGAPEAKYECTKLDDPFPNVVRPLELSYPICPAKVGV